MTDEFTGLAANRLVAYNLGRIRKTLGLSQAQAAERLAPYVGARWSKSVYSAAERSYDGNRVRQFTADDLVAFSLAFEVPVIYFFLPPSPDDRTADGILAGSTGLSWRKMLTAILGGSKRGSLMVRLNELPTEDFPSEQWITTALGLISATSAEWEIDRRREVIERDRKDAQESLS